MSGVALFGWYPQLPAAIRNAGVQPTFDKGHCILVRPAAGQIYSPPWVDEHSGVIGPETGCVPVTGVRGVNRATSGAKAPCTKAEWQALQVAMGTVGTGADELELARGIRSRYGLQLPYGQGWAPIVDAIGGEAVAVVVGDPLGWRDVAGGPLLGLKPYSAGLQYRYVVFPDPVAVEVPPVWANPGGATPVDVAIVIKPAAVVCWSEPGSSRTFRTGTAQTGYRVHAIARVDGWWGYLQGRGGVTWVRDGDLIGSPVPWSQVELAQRDKEWRAALGKVTP